MTPVYKYFRGFSRAAAFVLAAFAFASETSAQSWPQKPVRIIVPFAPGGGTDILTRLVAKKMGDNLSQPFVVENRAGASGIIGATAVAKAPPDGYTLLVGAPANFSINQFLYPKMTYVPEKELSGVTVLALVPQVLAVSNNLPVASVKELIDYAKARPGKLNYSSPGSGQSGHLAMELFSTLAGIKVTQIAYKGSGPAMAALAAGEVDLSIDVFPVYMGRLNDAKVRILGVSTTKRFSVLPNVPTIAESGLPEFSSSSWFALAAPAGTPRELINRISVEANKALNSPDILERIRAMGAEPIGGTPEEADRFFADEAVKWKRVIDLTGVKVDG